MGCGASAEIETPDDFPYFSITFHWTDTIRLTNADSRTYTLVKKALINYWDAGISGVTLVNGALDIKLKGRPFVKAAGREETFASKRGLCNLMEYILADGWNLVVCTELSRTIDTTSWFFERRPEMGVLNGGSTVKFCSVSLSNTDSIQLACCNPELYDATKRAFKNKYTKGIQHEQTFKDGDYQIKLNGNPWTSEAEEGMDARRALMQLLRLFQEENYFLYCKVNPKSTSDTLMFGYYPHRKPSNYCCISLNEKDRLRLIDFPEELVKGLRKVINKYRGEDGIQREGEYLKTYEFKLRGNPWCAEAQDTVYSRYFIAQLLEYMHANGWPIFATIDMSRKMDDKAVLVFKTGEALNAAHMCLAPADKDKLRVIGAPNEIIPEVRKVLNRNMPLGIQSEVTNYFGAYEFKLKGQPFSGTQGTDEYFTRSCMAQMMHKLRSLGWEVVASCDISARHIRTEQGPDFPVDTFSWFFAKLH